MFPPFRRTRAWMYEAAPGSRPLARWEVGWLRLWRAGKKSPGGIRWRSSVVEQLICNQQVGGSNPFASSAPGIFRAVSRQGKKEDAGFGPQLPWTYRFGPCRQRDLCWAVRLRGEVPEWPKGTDCKSVGVRLRRFESFPPHHVVPREGVRLR